MTRARIIWALAALVLASCSGNRALPANSFNSTGSTPVTFSVVIPNGSAGAKPTERARNVSPSTQSIVVALDSKTVLTMNVAETSKNCARGTASRECTARATVPDGDQTFSVWAFDGKQGHGNVLGSASIHAILRPGIPQRVGLSLMGKPASLAWSAATLYPPAGTPATVELSVVALDADGNAILGQYSAPISLKDGDTSGATRLSTSALNSSATKLELNYNGETLGTAHISAMMPGLPTATISFAPAPTTIARYVAPSLRIPPKTPPLPYGVSDICIGPDGSVWGTGSFRGAIEKVSPSGKYTVYTTRSLLLASPVGISVGSDGSLWFGELGNRRIGKVTSAGIITTFNVPSNAGGIPHPSWTTLGPDRRTWYVDAGSRVAFRVGAVTAAGHFSQYSLPQASSPKEIVAGPDGNLWISDSGLNAIVVLSTNGKVVAIHRLPTANAEPWGIAVGPDKNIWFTEFLSDKIGRVTLGGAISEFQVPSANAGPLNVTPGPDGSVWYTEDGVSERLFEGKIGYVTTDGRTIRDFLSGSAPVHIQGLAFDRRGHLWYSTWNVQPAFYSALDELVY